MTGDGTREVLAVRFGHRVTSRVQSYLNFHHYGEPDEDLDIDYFFWVIKEADGGATLVDTGFAPEVGARRRRASFTTPAEVLPALGIAPDDVHTIVITHAHWDHTGNIRQFPQASVVMTQAEYGFWTSPMAAREQFAAHAEPPEIALLTTAAEQGRLNLISGQYTLPGGIDLIEVGGHTPGQLIVSVPTPAGTAVLASDALHFYEEAEKDRPFAILADLPAMYRTYDLLNDLAGQPGTHLVAGHDPVVRQRFAAHPSGPDITDLTRPLAR
jgi:glyoxylase-like metal-dependent hydrolase (beta-lactamase superfamily II)